MLSPNTPSSTSKSKRRRDRENRKNSQHYQESDILDSYYRSSPADKISDYEDIWNTTDQSTQSTWNDRLKDCRVVCTSQNRLKSSNDRLMSPRESEKSFTNDRLPAGEQMILKSDRFILKNDKMSYKEMTSPEFSSFKPVSEMKSPDQGSPEETGMGRKPDLLSRVCKYNTISRLLQNAYKITTRYIFIKISAEKEYNKYNCFCFFYYFSLFYFKLSLFLKRKIFKELFSNFKSNCRLYRQCQFAEQSEHSDTSKKQIGSCSGEIGKEQSSNSRI